MQASELCPDCLGYGDIPTGYCHCGDSMDSHRGNPEAHNHSGQEVFSTCFNCMGRPPKIRYRLGFSSPIGFELVSYTNSFEEAESWAAKPSDYPGTMNVYSAERFYE